MKSAEIFLFCLDQVHNCVNKDVVSIPQMSVVFIDSIVLPRSP